MTPRHLPAVVALFAAAALASAATEGAPLVHWTFDQIEGLQVTDVSGHGMNGRIAGPAGSVAQVEGRSGRAVKFSDRAGKAGAIVLDRFPELDLSQGFTLEVWARGEGIASWKSCKRAEIMATGGDASPGFHFCVNYGSVRLVGALQDGQRRTLAAHNAVTRPLGLNTWHHFAVTCDQKTCRVYVDGEEAACGELPSPITPPRHALSVGAYDAGAAYGFPGALDELTIYNYVRTGLQIAQDARLRR